MLGFPCVIKPVMSSSGKGQSVVRGAAELALAWQEAQTAGRVGGQRIIVEGFVDFDSEITLLTVRSALGTTFCAPIGHRQEAGDYVESWQPQPMSEAALQQAEKKLTNMRASGSDENIMLTPPIKLTLEAAVEFIADDELVEAAPQSIRIRKRYLTENERKKASRGGG